MPAPQGSGWQASPVVLGAVPSPLLLSRAGPAPPRPSSAAPWPRAQTLPLEDTTEPTALLYVWSFPPRCSQTFKCNSPRHVYSVLIIKSRLLRLVGDFEAEFAFEIGGFVSFFVISACLPLRAEDGLDAG